MNRTFKVVFNKARGSVMVANEATRSVQKKGTKLLVATAVASVLSCSSAFAVDYSSNSGDVGYDKATAGEARVFEGETLNIKATGENTQTYGLLATGDKSSFTNKGEINLNLAQENAAKFWKTKGMMADNNGTVVNDGTINVTNAYGMTVGSSGETNTITNNKTINVDGQGAAMEVAPTGVSGTTGTAKGVANNNGTINVNSKDAYGIIVAGKDGVINQNGTLNAADGAAAILVQEESGKTTSGNTIVFGESSKTYGLINIQSGTSETDKEPVTGTTLEFKQGSVFDGRILASGANTTIKGVLGISGQRNASNEAGAAIFIGNTTSSLTLQDSVFADNSITGTDVYGGAIYSYGQTELKNVTFEGNSIVSTDVNPDKVNNGGIAQGAAGGAVMLKGNKDTVFEDVVFTNNSATANKNETTGGYAYGGALMVDYSTGAVTGDPRPSDVTFKVSKDLVYSGNTVSSDSTSEDFNTYGYHLPHAQAGGFLFLDRGSKATFKVAENATLTIGNQVTNDDTDGIASSIPDTFTASETAPNKKPVNEGKHAEIVKSGNGELIVNGSLNKYYGTVDVQTGTMTVNSHWDIKNAVTVQSGATLALNDFAFVGANDEGNPNQDKDGNEIGGSLTVNGTLQTISSMAFADVSGETLELSSAMNQVTFAGDSAAVALADETYTLDYAQKAGTAFEGKNVEVVMLGTLEGVDGSVTLEDVSNISGQTVLNAVTIAAENKNVQIGGENPGEEVAWRAEDLSVGAIDLGSANQLMVTGNATLKLSGVDGNLVTSTSKNGVAVNVDATATLVLGGAAAQGGTLDATVTVAGDAQMNVTGNADYVVSAVSGAGTVNVGEASSAGRLTVNSTEGFTGTFFADPAWKTEGGNTVEEASQLAITDVSGEIGYKVAAGRNSVVSLGAESSEAKAAFNAIAGGNGLSLGDQEGQISAVLYVGKKINLGTNGGILVDGSKTEVPTIETGLTVAANGMLIANQSAVSGEEALVTGTVGFDSNSYLGLSNAVEGEFKLADTVTGAGNAQVVTDNPFISGSLGEDGTVATKTDVDSGLKSIESLGLQAMTRRADGVLASTIADRTSFGQQLKPGLNLWVDVAGENYQADDFDKGGEFEADMGYGTFGADVAVGNFTLGGALQYGTGTLRSSVNGIKNSIDNYGVSLYGTYSVTDNFKLGAELAYVWGENDITADQTALNQSVDTEMYSAGVRAMYEMKAGNFRFVPSIGLRVSQLSTDEMKVGAVKIEDQDQTFVQLPIAMRITAADYSTASGWTLSPSFKIAYVPTFGDKDIEVLNTAEDVIDTSPVQADFGLLAGKDNMLFNVNFMLGAGEYGSSAVGGKVGFKYAF